MSKHKHSLRHQSLPVMPIIDQEPVSPGLWSACLLLLLGVAIGSFYGLFLAHPVAADGTIYEHLTDDDRAELNELIKKL